MLTTTLLILWTVLAAAFAFVTLVARRELNTIHWQLKCQLKLISDLWDTIKQQRPEAKK